MRVDLIAPPFSGHLHPILAIGIELSEAFDVRVISTPGAQARIRKAGLEGVTILTDGDEQRLVEITDPPHAAGSNPVRMHRQFRAAIGSMFTLRTALQDFYRTDRPDLAIVDFVVAAAGPVLEARGIRWWTSMPSPCVIETPDGPPAYLGGMRPARNAAERLSQAVGRLQVRTFKRCMHALHRSSLVALGVSGPYRADGSERVYAAERILALGLEQLEFARTWPAAVRFVGPYLHSPAQTAAPPEFRVDRSHVLVTSGTHLRWFKNRLADAVATVARAMPEVVFHLSDGDARGAWAPIHLADNLVRFPYIDYATTLDRYDLVVHHGGAGVMYHCLSRGKPAIVFPVDYDQFDHAARLAAAGAAIHVRRLDDLGAAIRAEVRDRRCLAVSRAMRVAIDAVRAQRPVLALVREFDAARRR